VILTLFFKWAEINTTQCRIHTWSKHKVVIRIKWCTFQKIWMIWKGENSKIIIAIVKHITKNPRGGDFRTMEVVRGRANMPGISSWHSTLRSFMRSHKYKVIVENQCVFLKIFNPSKRRGFSFINNREKPVIETIYVRKWSKTHFHIFQLSFINHSFFL